MGCWGITVCLAIGSFVVVSEVQAMGTDKDPVVATTPRPVEARFAATVAARVYNRGPMQVRDGEAIGQMIRTLAEDTGAKPRHVLTGDTNASEVPMAWHEPVREELAAMDPLTVSVLHLPAASGVGAAILVSLWLVRVMRLRREA